MYQSNTKKKLLCFYCIRATCFDSYRNIFRPLKDTDPYSVRICILEGPEDDSISIETWCPNTIIIVIKFCCV